MRTFLYKIKLFGLNLIKFFGQLLRKIVLKNKGKRADIKVSAKLDQLSLDASLEPKDHGDSDDSVDIKINIKED